jgi:hypothetical protein
VTHLGLRGPGLTLPSAGPGPHTGAIGFRIGVHATSTDFCIMPYRAKTNEFEHPYVVELAVVSDGLDVELSQRIMQFHKSRHIRLRYGRSGSNYYRWCFSDLLIARAFAEQFSGEFCKPSI